MHCIKIKIILSVISLIRQTYFIELAPGFLKHMSMSFSERLLKTVKANIANNIFSTTKRKIAFIACYVMDKIFIGLERDLLKFVNLRSTMSHFKCPLCGISKTKSLIEKKSKLNIMKCLSSEHWSQSYKIVIKLRQLK